MNGYGPRHDGVTNPAPDDPGSQQPLDGGSTGTSTGPEQAGDLWSGANASSTVERSSGRGETAASGELPAAREGR